MGVNAGVLVGARPTPLYEGCFYEVVDALCMRPIHDAFTLHVPLSFFCTYHRTLKTVWHVMHRLFGWFPIFITITLTVYPQISCIHVLVC